MRWWRDRSSRIAENEKLAAEHEERLVDTRRLADVVTWQEQEAARVESESVEQRDLNHFTDIFTALISSTRERHRA